MIIKEVSFFYYNNIFNKCFDKKKQKREYKKSKILSKKWEMQRKDVNMICTNMKFICDTQTSRNTSFGKEPTQSSNYILFYCTNSYHVRHEHLHNRLHIVSLPLLLGFVWIYFVCWRVCDKVLYSYDCCVPAPCYAHNSRSICNWNLKRSPLKQQ